MKIAVVGATGRVGSRVVTEALSRGHVITAIARDVNTVKPQANLVAMYADAGNVTELAGALAGNDAVVSALRYVDSDPTRIVDAIKHAGIKRYVAVGGAGSLEVAPGKQLIDEPNFPAAYRAESLKARDFLSVLRREDELDWTYLSPSAELAPGLRTGKFRLGHDQLLVDANGKSWVSMEDCAIALVRKQCLNLACLRIYRGAHI
jgi:putative NADH-flavin reductase